MPFQLGPRLDFLIRRCARVRITDVEKGEGKPDRCHIDRLTNDILVDQVFIYLDVFEILRLRQVSKLYYYLTHHAALWKRLLLWTDVPLPPLPPTTRHSLQNLNGMETERLLLRAISLDRSWKSNEPKYLYDWSFNAHHDVLSMVLLPGGQYLVASVADRVQKHYAIVVFAMDHRTAGAVPLAKTPTTTKAFHLQAKYMTIKEERGIVISYVRRDYKHFRDRRKGPFAPGAIDISKYSPDHDVDLQVPVKYECVTLHVSLYSLEVLSDPRFVPGSAEFLQHARAQPRPFRIIAVIRTRSPLGPPTLDEVFGSPYLAIVKRPNSIMFKNLNGGAVSTLTCSPSPVHPNEPHFIMAIRLLPLQNLVLVVRRVNLPPSQSQRFVGYIEFYHAIPSGAIATTSQHDTLDARAVMEPDFHIASVQISDHGIPTLQDDSVNPNLYNVDQPPAPRPISIFATTVDHDFIFRYTIFPRRVEHVLPPTPPSARSWSKTPRDYARTYATWSYDVMSIPLWKAYHGAKDRELRIIPGSLRAIAYEVPRKDIREAPPILSIYRYYDIASGSFEAALNDPTTNGELRGTKVMKEFDVPAHVDLSSVQAMAWDETIGRLCISSLNSTRLYVLDFAKAPRLDDQGQRVPLPVLLNPDPDEIMAPFITHTAEGLAEAERMDVSL
ncbi:hypothetical protein AcV5_005347 [Taiwanofungus camphoratus]|nr:hypothetical protein AcV5_005347 [Antrodia cinnamomea]